MGRAPRIDVEGGHYHVMNRGAGRQTVFFSDADRVEFGRLLGLVHERFGVEILAYCLMDNHYHLLIHCPDGWLSDAMQVIGSVFTRHANERVQRDGPLFRGRFHAVPVLTDEQLVVTARYIHRNALDVAGVDDVAAYRWSSHRAYLGFRHCPSFLRPDRILAMFAGSAQAFDDFVRADPNGGPTLPTHDRFSALIGAAIDSIYETETAAPNIARTVAILLLDELSDTDRIALRRRLAFASVDATARAIRRARQRARTDPRLRWGWGGGGSRRGAGASSTPGSRHWRRCSGGCRRGG